MLFIKSTPLIFQATDIQHSMSYACFKLELCFMLDEIKILARCGVRVGPNRYVP